MCILFVYSALMASFNNGFETPVKILMSKGRPWGMGLKEGRDLEILLPTYIGKCAYGFSGENRPVLRFSNTFPSEPRK